MNNAHIDAYLARHPNAELLEPEYPHCGAALNALFGRDVWIRDEDIEDAAEELEECGDDLRVNRGVTPEAARARRAKAAMVPGRLQWRAPVETFSGPCSLWRETHSAVPDREGINQLRAQVGEEPLPADAPELQPRTYTAYTLICAVDKLGDADFQVLVRMCDRHNLSLGVSALDNKVLVHLSLVR